MRIWEVLSDVGVNALVGIPLHGAFAFALSEGCGRG